LCTLGIGRIIRNKYLRTSPQLPAVYLANEFNSLKKTKTDVRTIPRSMAKLFNEAGKVKNVLSANAAIYAQVSNRSVRGVTVTRE